MNGKSYKLPQYLEGSNKRFVVPPLVRNYVWTLDECKRFFDDLTRLGQSADKSYFFGTIATEQGNQEDYRIIDGQQRLVTASLFLLAARDLLVAKKISSKESDLAKTIYESFLVDRWNKRETRLILKSTSSDQEAYASLFDAKAERVVDSNVTINYNYFCERLQEKGVSIDALFDAFCRIELVGVTLNDTDDPRSVFECANMTGTSLGVADRIRAYVMNGAGDKGETLWRELEKLVGDRLESFACDYVDVKYPPENPRIPEDPFARFKSGSRKSHSSADQNLESLRDFARLYRKLDDCETKDRTINACVARLGRFRSYEFGKKATALDAARPFLLEILTLCEEGSLKYAEAREIFLIVESYLFRRSICGMSTHRPSNIFSTLHRTILSRNGQPSSYIEKFKYVMLTKKELARFPSDEEFAEAFSTTEIYPKSGQTKTYVLERLENLDSAESKDVFQHVENGDYTVEHIMPQSLAPEWRKALGPEAERIHQTWLHRIANLTLTAYNSEYGALTFQEKRDMPKGFRDSGIRMNRAIGKKNSWGKRELIERSEELTRVALELWPTPQTSFAPAPQKKVVSDTIFTPQKKKAKKELALSFEKNSYEIEEKSTGKTLVRYEFKGVSKKSSSLSKAIHELFRKFYASNETVLRNLARKKTEKRISADPNSLGQAMKLGNDVFIETRMTLIPKL